ncbi:MAG: hypothetical protein ACFFFT_18105, partial [Candidatus Thorarchaeota archaeon]
MLTEQNEEELLEKAELAEKECDWSKALKLYEQVAELYLSKNKIEKAAQTYKKLAYTYWQSIGVVNTAEELIICVKSIIKNFEKAEKLFNEYNNREGAMECKSGVYRTKMITATSHLKSKEAADDALKLEMQLIEIFREKDEKENLVRALTRSAGIIGRLLSSSTTFEESFELSQKGIKFANEALNISKEIRNIDLLSNSLILSLQMQTELTNIVEFRGVPEFKNAFKTLLIESEEALKHVEDKNDYYSLMNIYRTSGLINFFFAFHYIEDERNQKEYFDKGLNHLEKSLELARKIQDKTLILYCLFYIDWWALFSGNFEYLQDRMARDILEMEEMGKQFERFIEYSRGVTRGVTVYYANMARLSFFNIKQRITYAELGIQYGEKFLENFPPGSPTPLIYII